jgi:hypothetical protein
MTPIKILSILKYTDFLIASALPGKIVLQAMKLGLGLFFEINGGRMVFRGLPVFLRKFSCKARN